MIYKQLGSITKYRILIILCLSFLLLSLNAHAANYPIKWTPEKIEETLGFEAAKDIPTTFVSSIKLKNVAVRVVPNLQKFVRVEPSYFCRV